MANVSATHICAHNSAALLLAAVLPPHTHTHTHACAYESPVAFVYDCIAALNLRHGLYIYYIFVYMYIHKYAFVAVPLWMLHATQETNLRLRNSKCFLSCLYTYVFMPTIYGSIYTYIYTSTHRLLALIALIPGESRSLCVCLAQ